MGAESNITGSGQDAVDRGTSLGRPAAGRGVLAGDRRVDVSLLWCLTHYPWTCPNHANLWTISVARSLTERRPRAAGLRTWISDLFGWLATQPARTVRLVPLLSGRHFCVSPVPEAGRYGWGARRGAHQSTSPPSIVRSLRYCSCSCHRRMGPALGSRLVSRAPDPRSARDHRAAATNRANRRMAAIRACIREE